MDRASLNSIIQRLQEEGKISEAEALRINFLVDKLINEAYNKGWRDGYSKALRDLQGFRHRSPWPEPMEKRRCWPKRPWREWKRLW